MALSLMAAAHGVIFKNGCRSNLCLWRISNQPVICVWLIAHQLASSASANVSAQWLAAAQLAGAASADINLLAAAQCISENGLIKWPGSSVSLCPSAVAVAGMAACSI